MHWMILFAGLTYGPLSGLIIGASIPVVFFNIRYANANDVTFNDT